MSVCCKLPQLLYYYDALSLGSITIAYIIMTMHDIVCSINIAGGDVVVYGALRLAPPNRPSDERPPVMYGHFCLVPRVSVHDRYYCSQLLRIVISLFQNQISAKHTRAVFHEVVHCLYRWPVTQLCPYLPLSGYHIALVYIYPV